ncbi:MAG: delta-aminolevulinic acid dehydratase [Alphaproteobacteria bacterium]|nr:MAG: delta-aminolevulinic acid dehydratase [Alphaproteobacteria bacterium]
MNSYSFPLTRMRRTRSKKFIRNLVKENRLTVNDLIYPIFIVDGTDKKEPIPEMPGLFRYSLDNLKNEIKNILSLNIPAIAIFPKISNDLKNSSGSEALNKNNIVCNAIKLIKDTTSELGIVCDVALDPYTDHGHDGVIINDYVDNDETVKILCEQALIQTEAGCDIIAPSDMMDGRIRKIRETLENNNYKNTLIMSYTAKYSSSFYGPFRHAVGSSNNFGNKDKSSYQMDYGNSKEAIREAELDISEGADMIMVKPGLPYLDIISKLNQKFDIPIFAYQVSGEYSMIMNAINNGLLDRSVILETLTSFKRAGCSGILTYFAPVVSKILNEDK